MNNYEYDCNTAYCDFHTSDLPFAAALVSLGLSVLEMHAQGPNRVLFGFAGSSKIGPLQNEFYSKSLIVDALTYATSIRALKNHIYSRQTL